MHRYVISSEGIQRYPKVSQGIQRYPKVSEVSKGILKYPLNIKDVVADYNKRFAIIFIIYFVKDIAIIIIQLNNIEGFHNTIFFNIAHSIDIIIYEKAQCITLVVRNSFFEIIHNIITEVPDYWNVLNIAISK